MVEEEADFAQAGAKDITKLDEALKLTKEIFDRKIMRKYIGIDYGDVRAIGISTCDSLGILASGLCVIDKTKTNYIKEIVDICNQENTFKLY